MNRRLAAFTGELKRTLQRHYLSPLVTDERTAAYEAVNGLAIAVAQVIAGAPLSEQVTMLEFMIDGVMAQLRDLNETIAEDGKD